VRLDLTKEGAISNQCKQFTRYDPLKIATINFSCTLRLTQSSQNGHHVRQQDNAVSSMPRHAEVIRGTPCTGRHTGSVLCNHVNIAIGAVFELGNAHSLAGKDYAQGAGTARLVLWRTGEAGSETRY